jgi:hemerythrin-like domain-containing protein
VARSDPADLSMMYVIHDAFRRDLARLVVAVAALPDADTHRARHLAERWGFVAHALHHHHTGEDDHIWPLMRRKAPEHGPLLDEMAGEHARIDPLLARVQAGFDRLVGGDGSARAPLVADLRELSDVLGAHLGHEEREVVPLLERHITKGELKEFEDSQRKSMKLRDVGRFLPWLLDDLDDDRRRHVLAELPPPLRLLNQRRWAPRYAKQSAGLWG